ncbi:MAG: bactofilin family protein, partial [Bacteroidota bacterium]
NIMAKNKNNETNALAVNIIANGTTLKGDIQTESDFRIDGFLNGNIHSKGKVIIGETGRVEGEIHCDNADISGTVSGNMKVQSLLMLKASAKVQGEVVTARLSIEEGANFSANCSMDNANLKNETKQKRPQQSQ